MIFMIKVNVYGIDGKVKEKINLPKIFNTTIRPDIIQKSFNVLHANRRTPYGAYRYAGAEHATASVGKGRGMSRVPRLTQGRSAALAPCVVGGRRAHPPTPNRKWNEKINRKENLLARKSAIAATAQKDLVKQRGHIIKDTITLPIIVEDAFGDLIKTKEVLQSFEKIGIINDINRSKNGTHIRAGRGKSRGRRYKKPKSILIISDNKNIKIGSSNISGVDVVEPDKLNIEHLAPGGVSGRLAIITQSTLHMLGGD
jgi:large subunit ribosomal protein L4e